MITKITKITCDVCGADCSTRHDAKPSLIQSYHLDIQICGCTVAGAVIPRTGEQTYGVDMCPKCYENWMLLNHGEVYRKPTEFIDPRIKERTQDRFSKERMAWIFRNH